MNTLINVLVIVDELIEIIAFIVALGYSYKFYIAKSDSDRIYYMFWAL